VNAASLHRPDDDPTETSMLTHEESAGQHIDEALDVADWTVQDAANANVRAAPGVAIREFPLKHGHGLADYLL
jgi:type I restriction enzyme R subunit